MKEQDIEQVRIILEQWNPLGDRASSIEDLDGYKTEAIDILSSYKIIPGLKLNKAVKSVIEGAFDITVDTNELNVAVEKISKIIDK